VIPCTDVQAVEFVMAGVTAEDFYVQRVKNHWMMKIRSASYQDLERYIWDLGPREAQFCRKLRASIDLGSKFEHLIIGDLDLNKLERLVTELKVRTQERVGSDDGANNGKLVGYDSGVLELLRMTILLTIIKQLQRQAMGLIG
jgi:hypothetical protein